MKRFLSTNFQNNLQLTPGHGMHRNLIIFHSKKIKPVECAMKSIIGAKLSDKGIPLF